MNVITLWALTCDQRLDAAPTQCRGVLFAFFNRFRFCYLFSNYFYDIRTLFFLVVTDEQQNIYSYHANLLRCILSANKGLPSIRNGMIAEHWDTEISLFNCDLLEIFLEGRSSFSRRTRMIETHLIVAQSTSVGKVPFDLVGLRPHRADIGKDQR